MGLKTAAILFIFGASIASGQFMPKLLRPTPYDMSVMPYHRSNGCPSAPELAPVICQFMEPHMGFFKPQLIVPSTFIPPLVIEKCDKPQLEIEFPPKKPIVIPEAPILPPITIPKFPVPVIKPLPPVPLVEPCEPAPIVVTAGAADVMVTGLNIPAAPLLPPLEMPALPEIVEVHAGHISEAVINDQSLMVPHPPMVPALAMPELLAVPPMMAPCPEDELISVPIPEFIQPLAPIPAAFELAPTRLHELPLHVLPPQPIAPPMIIENVEEPCITGEIVHRNPVIIAQPPRLPAPMPIFPAYETAIIADPCEPPFQPITKVSRAPYFVRPLPPYAAAQATSPALFPAREMFPYIHRI